MALRGASDLPYAAEKQRGQRGPLTWLGSVHAWGMRMAGSISDQTVVRLPVAVLATLLSACLGAGATVIVQRDKVMSDLKAVVAASILSESDARRADLSHYVTREEFAEWRREERARQDEQYLNIITSLGRVEARVGRR